MLKHPTSWQEELRRGLRLASKGAFDPARHCFERAHTLAPEQAETCCALGRELLRRGQAESALALLEQAWNQDHHFQSAGLSLARCLALGLGRHEDGHAIVDELASAAQDDDAVRIVRCEILLSEGRHEDAARTLEGLSAEPDEMAAKSAALIRSRIANERGMQAIREGAADRALFDFKRASDLDPHWSAPLTNLGATFEQLGRVRRAEQAYERAVEIEPGAARPWHNLGRLRARRGDARAVDCLERAHLSSPAAIDIAADYASALADQGQLQSATDLLNRHSDLHEGSAAMWTQVGIRLARSGHFDLAERALWAAHERSSALPQRKQLEALLSHRDLWSSAQDFAPADRDH